jgi:phosphatidate cytidylyltransferase
MNVNRNLIQRTVTGILFVAVMVGCILGGFLSFGILFMLVAMMAVREFCTLVNAQKGVSVNTPICMVAAAGCSRAIRASLCLTWCYSSI